MDSVNISKVRAAEGLKWLSNAKGIMQEAPKIVERNRTGSTALPERANFLATS